MGARVAAAEVAECFGRTQLDSAARYIRRCDGSLFPVAMKVAGRHGEPDFRTRIDPENDLHNNGLPRIAVKMATGTGKTIVMCMLIAWQVCNKVYNKRDARFTSRFLVIAPGIVDGWLRTGDVAIQDSDGFIYIQDRIKDMIISGGENVYPAEIENVLMAMEGVADAAVIGVPSEKWGESPLAVIVRASDDVSPEDVIAHCDGKLARFKMPKAVEFTDAIPRNPTGKVLKRVLREQYETAST